MLGAEMARPGSAINRICSGTSAIAAARGCQKHYLANKVIDAKLLSTTFFPQVSRAPSETSLQLTRGSRCGVYPGQRNLGDHFGLAPSMIDIVHAMHRQLLQVRGYTDGFESGWLSPE